MKKCWRCKQLKTDEHFNKDGKTKDGLSARCKNCNRELQQKWRSENPEASRAIGKRSRTKHRERRLAERSAYHRRRSVSCPVSGCSQCLCGGGRTASEFSYQVCTFHGRGELEAACGGYPCAQERRRFAWSYSTLLTKPHLRWKADAYLYVVEFQDGAGVDCIKPGLGTNRRLNEHIGAGAVLVDQVFGPRLLVKHAERAILIGTKRQDWLVDLTEPVPIADGVGEVRHADALGRVLRGVERLRHEVKAHNAGEEWPGLQAEETLYEMATNLGLPIPGVSDAA